MRAGSLFSGVGGLDLGLARAGFQHAFFCESDPWRRTVLSAHWPGVPVYHDVRSVAMSRDELRSHGVDTTGEWTRHGRGSVDLLCGGFPCQDLSVAGNRAGLAGDRSGLFFEFARIIDAVRPRWVLLENVPGLLSSNGGRDFGTVLGTLADIGYGLGWRTLDSRFFGVPQRRRRVFIVGTLADGDPRSAAERAGQVLAVGTRCPGHPPQGTQAREDIAIASLSGLGTGGPDDNDGQAGRLVAPDISVTLSSSGHAKSQPNRRHEDDFNLVPHIGENVRRLTPVECERLQAWPDNWTNPTGDAPDSRRYAACGDGVTATVAEWIGRRMMAA